MEETLGLLKVAKGRKVYQDNKFSNFVDVDYNFMQDYMQASFENALVQVEFLQPDIKIYREKFRLTGRLWTIS